MRHENKKRNSWKSEKVLKRPNNRVIANLGIFCREQRRFLLVAAKATKPSEADLATLLKPTAEVIGQIQSFRYAVVCTYGRYLPNYLQYLAFIRGVQKYLQKCL